MWIVIIAVIALVVGLMVENKSEQSAQTTETKGTEITINGRKVPTDGVDHLTIENGEVYIVHKSTKTQILGYEEPQYGILDLFNLFFSGDESEPESKSDPHYGYRHGRWYYGSGHQHGCEKNGGGAHGCSE